MSVPDELTAGAPPDATSGPPADGKVAGTPGGPAGDAAGETAGTPGGEAGEAVGGKAAAAAGGKASAAADGTSGGTVGDGAGTGEAPESDVVGWPRHRRLARFAVLLAVFLCAACGLVYELALVALGSYLIGDAIGQASIVLAVMVFAMGVGAFAAKPLQRRAAAAFAGVEVALALLGGLSVLGLYAAYAWLDLYVPAMVLIAFVVGCLIGAEIPLLMVLLQRIRRQEVGSAVSDLFAVDYVGGLLGGLAFPFLLLPVFGLVQGALLVGAVNAVAGLGLVLGVFRRSLPRRSRAVLAVLAALVAVLLATTYGLAGRFEVSARQALYDDPIVVAERSHYQEIVITQSLSVSHPDVRLYLDGDLQFSSVDEYRYHEALVHPALSGRRSRVLVLGGGDGLALREVLRYRDVRQATLVELDPEMIRLARHDPRLSRLNRHSFEDPRVRIVNQDAMTWLKSQRDRYDAVIVDMPDPDSTATAKLYSTEFYTLLHRVLGPGGRLVVQAGSPYFAPRSYWCIEAGVRAAGWHTTPYHVDVPSFGDWGYVLAGAHTAPTPRLAPDAPRTRFLTPAVLRASTVFPADRARRHEDPSTLTHPRIIDLEREEWKNY